VSELFVQGLAFVFLGRLVNLSLHEHPRHKTCEGAQGRPDPRDDRSTENRPGSLADLRRRDGRAPATEGEAQRTDEDARGPHVS